MSMSTESNTPNAATNATDLVKKQIFVKATPQRAFDVFTREMDTWWPLATHHISKIDAKNAVIEPFVGGRWFERGIDDSECDWGKVLAWDPPARLVLAWQISASWQHDAKLMTEVEVRFTAENGGTRVELEHRLLRNFGARTDEMRSALDSEGGWTGLLGMYAGKLSAA
jgi:uncharacterized protein YndB with AHSA1/START domain